MSEKKTKYGWLGSIESVNKELMRLLEPMLEFPANTTSVELKFGIKQCPSVTITYLILPEKEGEA